MCEMLSNFAMSINNKPSGNRQKAPSKPSIRAGRTIQNKLFSTGAHRGNGEEWLCSLPCLLFEASSPSRLMFFGRNWSKLVETGRKNLAGFGSAHQLPHYQPSTAWGLDCFRLRAELWRTGPPRRRAMADRSASAPSASAVALCASAAAWRLWRDKMAGQDSGRVSPPPAENDPGSPQPMAEKECKERKTDPCFAPHKTFFHLP